MASKILSVALVLILGPVDLAIAQHVEKAKLNEPFRLGDCTYTLTGVRESKQLVLNQYWKKEPSEGARFLVVYYTVENNTNEPLKALGFMNHTKLKVRDSKNRTYNANPSHVMYTGKEYSIDELPPGLPKKTAAVFEMPLSSFEEPASFTVIIPEDGDFTKQTREVRLVKKAKQGGETAPEKSPEKVKTIKKSKTISIN
jgi:hypothetical protein